MTEFTEAMSRFATGVSVVTVADGRDDVGGTVSSLASVSADPPIVMVGLHREGYLAEALGRCGEFAVNVLGAQHRPIAGRFAAEGRPSARLLLAGEPHSRGPRTSALVLDTALVALECAVRDRQIVGDHWVVLADVTGICDTAAPSPPEPLVRFLGRYRALAR